MKLKHFLLNSFIGLNIVLISSNSFANKHQQILSDVKETISVARTKVMNNFINNEYWFYPLYLGSMYSSQYFLLRKWLSEPLVNKNLQPLPKTRFNEEWFKNYLISSQLKDGSWQIIYDANTREGDLNTSIMHYAALKAMGVEPTSKTLQDAKRYILKQGGIEKSSLFTKVILSLFGNYSWNAIPSIPYFIFEEKFPLNYKDFGQWIGPHLFPISYLRSVQPRKQLGPEFDLSELWVNAPGSVKNYNDNFQYSATSYKPDESDRDMILKMLEKQEDHGSFSGYTSASLFSVLSFQQYQNHFNDLDNVINSATAKAMEFVDNLYFKSGSSSYLGVTCDGRYWDTALVGQGLLESGMEPERFKKSIDYLFSIKDPKTNGFGFGLDFERFPDTDDTAEIIMYFKKAGVDRARVIPSIQWLLSMQNDDGGWGAFDKNNTGNIILKIATKDFLDSADMFDESSADVTGHILESLSAWGLTIKNSPHVAKAVKYLLTSQDKNLPAWLGRWGVNYIYGTSASLIGLVRAGVETTHDKIQSSVKWLKNCQNEDGGFGEGWSSYTDWKKACKGISTPSQTAWALMALLETGHGDSETAMNAAKYLTKSFKERKNRFEDFGTYVGTGHPKIVPMHYPSYAWGFTLMALSRYRDHLEKQHQ